MKRYIAAIDQGTTGTRCIIFDKAGRVVSSAYEEHRQFYPQPGGVEHNPLEIWEKTKKVIKNALRLKKIDSNEIAGIGVTNQRETTIVWDPHTGNPFCNALVWQDTKTRDLCCQMSEGGLEGLVRDRTGLVINTYFSAPKIRWMLENVPEVKEKSRAWRCRIWQHRYLDNLEFDRWNQRRRSYYRLHQCFQDDVDEPEDPGLG